MTSPPPEPVDASEQDPSEDGPAAETVAGLIRTEEDLPDPEGPEVEVGLGPDA